MLVYSQDDYSFYKCQTKSSGTFTNLFMITMQGLAWMKNGQYPTCKIWVYLHRKKNAKVILKFQSLTQQLHNIIFAEVRLILS